MSKRIRSRVRAGALGLLLSITALVPCAYSITEAAAVPCIIGEAAGEGPTGMRAVAEAMRNRGRLNGVYGCRASFVDREPAWVWEQARKAWRLSAVPALVNGATHWESTNFKTPYWAQDMKITARIGKHKFYKLK